jgi:hypothetical protein
MTRLELLKEEYETIRNLRTLSFDLLARVSSYYAHEIECIEKFGSPNPEVKNREAK